MIYVRYLIGQFYYSALKSIGFFTGSMANYTVAYLISKIEPLSVLFKLVHNAKALFIVLKA